MSWSGSFPYLLIGDDKLFEVIKANVDHDKTFISVVDLESDWKEVKYNPSAI